MISNTYSNRYVVRHRDLEPGRVLSAFRFGTQSSFRVAGNYGFFIVEVRSITPSVLSGFEKDIRPRRRSDVNVANCDIRLRRRSGVNVATVTPKGLHEFLV